MFCRNCGAKIPEGGNFCSSCGIPVKEELAAGGFHSKRPVIKGQEEGKGNDISREVRKNYSDMEAQGKSSKWIMTGVFLLAVGAAILFATGVVGGKGKTEEAKLSSVEAIKNLEKYNAYYQEKTEDKVLYLTFDCEYENGNTPEILDTLKKHNIEAAFFVVGNYLKTSPDLIKRMVQEGHIVGNLSYNYSDMSQMNREEFDEELREVETLCEQTTGLSAAKYYRPPQGKYSRTSLEFAKDLGYRTIFWSLAYDDGNSDSQPTHEEAFDKLLKGVHPGAIVRLHNTSEANMEVLDELLIKWEAMGYTFKSLEELP